MRHWCSVSIVGECPSGVSASVCSRRTSTGPSAGLGQVTGTYTFLLDQGSPSCAEGLGRAGAYPVRFSIASKGEIHFQLAAGAECVNEDENSAARQQTQTFTVTGGTGIYAGASGTGTVKRQLGSTPCSGGETWTGTLTVPGLEFDLTRPTLAGATNKTVRARKGAKSARVAFKVTAQRRPRRRPAGRLHAEVRKSLQDRQDARDVLLDRPQRQHCQRVVHGHRQAHHVNTQSRGRFRGAARQRPGSR